jgi:RNA polymerase sigma-70 factor (ECF subfamily)
MGNEREAIARLKHGDIGGLETLVQLYQTPALHAAYIISRDRALAEDIVQAAFLRAYETIHQFDADRLFRPWFLRSVVNATLRACAKRGRQLSLDAVDEDEIVALPSGDASLDEMMIAAASDEAVWATMTQLAPAQRAVVVMRYYLDMSEAEMAHRLNCPPGTVKRRLYDARQRLRRLLPAWVSHPIEE